VILPLQLIPLLEILRLEMEQVECLLNETLAGVEEPLRPMLRRSLGGGKPVRPALTSRRGEAGCLVRLVAIPDGRNCSESTSQTASFMV
jgi:hypothetical protein